MISKSPELLFDEDEISEPTSKYEKGDPEITMDLIQRMVSWDKKNKRLKPHHFRLMYDILNGKKELTTQNKKYCLINYRFISRVGFNIQQIYKSE